MGPVMAGLACGSVAAIIAALVQLPLHAPTDIVFNSLTVSLGSLATGLATGATWKYLRGSRKRQVAYLALWIAVTAAVMAASAVADIYLDRTLQYVAPLAAITLVTTVVGTPAIAGTSLLSRWMVAVAIVAAIGVGGGLMAMGDTQSGELKLPPRQGVIDYAANLPMQT